jgi:hypothetical protein
MTQSMTLSDIAGVFGVGPGWGARVMVRMLGSGPLEVIALSESIARAAERAGHRAIRASLRHGQLDTEDACADALCAAGLGSKQITVEVVRRLARAVRPGGRVLLATSAGLARRGPERHVLAALFMHAGLVRIQQRMSRGLIVTSGQVHRLQPA